MAVIVMSAYFVFQPVYDRSRVVRRASVPPVCLESWFCLLPGGAWYMCTCQLVLCLWWRVLWLVWSGGALLWSGGRRFARLQKAPEIKFKL